MMIICFAGSTDLLAAPRGNPYDFSKWLFTTTAFRGDVKSDLSVGYSIPYADPAQPDSFSLIRGEKSLPGIGPGGGMQIGGFYKGWLFQIVGFRFASKHNDGVRLHDAVQEPRADISGQVYYVRYTWRRKKSLFEPFVGAGYFAGFGPHMTANVRGFTVYSPELDRYLYYYDQKVDVYVRSPFPQLGLKIKLPIQNWHIAPFYAYSFESTITRIQSTPGNTVAAPNPLAAPAAIYNHLLTRPDEDVLPPFSLQFKRRRWNQRPGIAFYMDFRRFISLTVFAFRNVTHGRWIVRGLFNFMFHPNAGMTVFGEYSERSIATIRYWLVGPTIAFQF